MAPNETVEPKKTDSGGGQENVYAGVYHALLIGMIVSTGLFVAALVRALIYPKPVPLTPEWIKSQYHWAVVIHGLKFFDPTTFMMIATVLLILTPVARVLISIYLFLVDRDWKYVVVTGIVFLVMVLTVILSHFGLK